MTKKYGDILRELEPLLDHPQQLTELEKYKLTSWVVLSGSLKVVALCEAMDEGIRRADSTALKDRFLRAVDPGYMMVSPENKKIIGRAQQKIAEKYNSSVEEYAALLAEEERIKAEIEAARRNKIDAAAAAEALAHKRAEIDAMAARAAVLDKDMVVSKPLNVIKRNTRSAAAP